MARSESLIFEQKDQPVEASAYKFRTGLDLESDWSRTLYLRPGKLENVTLPENLLSKIGG